MHALGEYLGSQKSVEGDLCLMFTIDDDPENLEKLAKLEGARIVLDVSKFNAKRSLNANAYFWKLCDLIAKKLGSDKDTVYLMELRDHGVFEQIDVIDKAVDLIRPLFRFIEEDYTYTTIGFDADGQDQAINMISLKCYKGSHEYDTKQMSDLIEGAVNDAHDLGIETWTKEEIDNLIDRWEGR